MKKIQALKCKEYSSNYNETTAKKKFVTLLACKNNYNNFTLKNWAIK